MKWQEFYGIKLRMNYLNTLKERCLLTDLNNFLLYRKNLKKL